MTRSRDRNTKEHYKGVIRNLKKQVKRLMKENAQLRGTLDSYDEYDDELIEELKSIRCPSCSSDTYQQTKVLNRIIYNCSSCGHRVTAKDG